MIVIIMNLDCTDVLNLELSVCLLSIQEFIKKISCRNQKDVGMGDEATG